MEQARIASPQGTQSAQAARGKPAAQSKDSLADAQGGVAPGGFMALLAALGDGNAPEALVAQATAQDTLTAEPKDVAAQAVSQGGLLSWPWATGLAGGAAQEQAGRGIAVQGMAVQGMAVQGMAVQGMAVQGMAVQGMVAAQVPGAATGQGLSAGALLPLIPSDATLGEGSLLMQTALQDTAVPGDERGLVADIQGAVSAAGKRKLPGRLGGGSAQAGDAISAAGTQGLSHGVVGAKGQVIPAVQYAVAQPLAAERRDVGADREGARPLEFGVDGVPTALAQWVSDATVSGRFLARGAESGPTVSGAGVAELGQDAPFGSRSEAGTAALNPAMVGAEDAVAEQVAYWVHQNIQNARLTVRHEGQPVEVSVTLTGNEAHVAFGSDEVQTREMLDGSVAQLRDMLHQEGLVLSGVTVGESGRRQGDEEGGSGNSKNARKQAQVVLPAAEAQAAGRARVQGDRTVDIFV